LLPRIELDLVPGFCCAAHFALIAKENPASVQDYLTAGRALQRFWLTATQLNLQLQPEMTPLIFSGYVRAKLEFTKETALIAYAEELSNRLSNLLGETNLAKVVFLGRIGSGKPAYARSLRLPVKELIRTF
jgi:hypothetical protein